MRLSVASRNSAPHIPNSSPPAIEAGRILERAWLRRIGRHASRVDQRDVAGTHAGNHVGFFHAAHQVLIESPALRCFLPRYLVLNGLVVLGFGLGLFIKVDGPILVLDLLRHHVIVLDTRGDAGCFIVDGFLRAIQAGLQLCQLRIAGAKFGGELIQSGLRLRFFAAQALQQRERAAHARRARRAYRCRLAPRYAPGRRSSPPGTAHPS